jgi:DNA-binding transcriptional MerR regulator
MTNKKNKEELLSLTLIKERLSAIEEKKKGLIDDRLKFLMSAGYRASDTDLKYRQINILGSSGLLNGDKENSRGWRNFTFKDLVFLDIVSELRKYGLEGRQLKKIKDFFYKKNTDANLILTAVLFGMKITIALEPNGNFKIFELITGSLSLEKSYKSVIQLNLNEFVNTILERIGMDKINYSSTLESVSKMYNKK